MVKNDGNCWKMMKNDKNGENCWNIVYMKNDENGEN